MKPQGNFQLERIVVGIGGTDTVFSINNLLSLKYIEDIKRETLLNN